ncbi:MAG: transcriptional regulator, GntR family with aminotransferase domain [Chthoniobacteraceae bacterium]|nr:transcriptional regulator, GntR family with aminotransferase domain [Chthoniobacteraceae bacterium]
MPKRESSQGLALRPPPEGLPLFRWVYEELRAAIIEGRLKPGSRLPSTRSLSRQHGVSRGTIVSAFEQLMEEGYVETRVGSGTSISRNLPDRFFQTPRSAQADARRVPSSARLSKWALALAAPFSVLPPSQISQPFQPNQPALDLFPIALWSQLAGRRLRGASPRMLTGGDPMGYGPLRAAVAAYLGSARGVKCAPEQIFIVSGTQQALDLTARLVLDPGDQVWVEDPGYPGAVAAFSSAGAKVVGVPVDSHGLDVSQGQRLAPEARLAYITPAHQFPLGVSLSLERRLALLGWAQGAGAWIFEDDYDGEYRFSGRPLPAVQGLDTTGCVIFGGSFNKMLFPALRLGYVVVPPQLVEAFSRARSQTDRFAPVLDQAILCDFITEGHFGQHIRRMREAYAERLAALHGAADGPLAGLLEIVRIQAGLQTAARLPANIPDREATIAAAALGIHVDSISNFQISRRDINGLILGFASSPPEQIREGAKRLVKALKGFSAV